MSGKKEKKVALIGPVLPFRGGVAQHTTMLHRALGNICESLTVSFTRQYPMFLFPGEDDHDPDYHGYREEGVEYLIDSVNPLTWMRAVRRIRAFGADVVVFPWWHVYWTFCFGFIAKALRANGREVIFFCHNVVEHESAGWKVRLTRRVFGLADRFIVHTREDQANLLRLLPEAQITVHPHPIYDQFPAAIGELPRRADLELLFYGFVRPYKGLDVLIEAMSRVNGNVFLTVAGEFWDGEADVRSRIEKHGLQNRVELRPKYHSDAETAELFARCDAVVLPYRSATGSGVVPLAYHYDKPVVVTEVGGLPDAIIDKETGWLVPPEDVAALTEVINGLSSEVTSSRVAAIRRFKAGMTWESLANACMGESAA